MRSRRNNKKYEQVDDGKKLKNDFEAKTEGQRKYIRAIYDNTVIFVTGPAGSGKSYLGIGVACRKLINGDINQIVLARPTIEASPKGLGFLPGDLNSKIFPYLLPAIIHLKHFLGEQAYSYYVREKKICFEPLEYMRGRTFDRSILILEESQNCTKDQLIMFITRMGRDSFVIIDGDVDQTDLRKNKEGIGDLEYVINKLKKANLKEFSIVELNDNDIIRNKLIKEFLNVFR